MRELVEFFIEHSTIILGISGAAIAGLVGYLSELNRFRAYGLVTLAIFPSAYFLKAPFYIPLLTISIIILISGLFYFINFLRNNPKIRGDELDDEEKKGM